MPRFHKLRTLPHPAQNLFDLVLDIETYPQFLPWCCDARVANRTHNSLDGVLMVGTRVVHSSFTSFVRFDVATGIISMKAHSNLFSHFRSRWCITSAEDSDSSVVDFVVDFELRSLPFGIFFEGLFEQAALRMVEAFERRASFLAARRRVIETQ